MNFTGDGNGFDMVTMPLEFRTQVPTSNFFQRGGYERNPIARRTGNGGRAVRIDRQKDGQRLPIARRRRSWRRRFKHSALPALFSTRNNLSRLHPSRTRASDARREWE